MLARLSPTSVYCLVAILAVARMITLSHQQARPQYQTTLRDQQQQHHEHHQTSQITGHNNQRHDSPNSTIVSKSELRNYNDDAAEPTASIGATLTRRRLTGRNSSSPYRERARLTAALNSNNSTAARQVSTRIETLDDISHRLDQTSVPPGRLPEPDDTRVPFWNIAHMINSIEQVDLALRAGSNGIETDISFDKLGRPVEAYHGFPCDCGRHCHHREDFIKFVRHIARVTIAPPGAFDSSLPPRLFLVLFDLKLKDLKEAGQKETAGAAMAEILHKNLYAEYERQTGVRSRSQLERNIALAPPVRVVISINHAHDLPLTKAFLSYMARNRLDFMSQFIGWDVGMNDPLENITAAWDSLGRGVPANIWQGDGLTNCANIVRGVERLKDAITIRNNAGHFRKVYYWTADVPYHIRSVLRLGLDAILTNQPQRAIQVLSEPEFVGKYRLATAYDDPFQQYWITPTKWRMSFPSVSELNETVAGIQKTGQNFIKTIPDGVAAVLKKVHSSIG